MALTGYTNKTYKNLQLNAGMFVKSFNPEVDDIATAKILGATQGGGNFTAIPEMRAIELDGVRGVAVGMQVIDSWEVKLTTTLKEMTAENFKLALASGKITKATGEEKYDKITANNNLSDADYIDNVCWLGTLAGSSEPVCILVKNVLNTNGLNFTFEDKGDGSIEIELTGHYSADSLDSPPFTIYTPKEASLPASQSFTEEY